jgi:hypothetical protein
MSRQFSQWERKLARSLNQVPGLKRFLKRNYQQVIALFFRPPYDVSTSVPISDVAPQETGETFFGYYDKSPESPTSEFLLFHQSSWLTKKLPDPTVPIRIVCMTNDGEKKLVDISTTAYNWQQGARLQWISDSSFIFNDFDKHMKRYVSKVIDVKNEGCLRTLPSPVNDVFGEEYYLSLNYGRLSIYAPDYGYRNVRMKRDDLQGLKNDGVYYGEIASGQQEPAKLLISLRDIVEIKPLPSMQGADHTINHLTISPDGDTFLLVHRWYQYGKRYDRLLCIPRDGSDLQILADNSMVSHVAWINSTVVAGYFRNTKGKDGYFKIDTYSKKEEELFPNIKWPYGDGHPSFFDHHLITDCYPDRSRLKSLIHVDLYNNTTQVLGTFFESLSYYGETRCDLHPRFSPSGAHVYFDSVHTGRRRLYRIAVPK